MRELLSKSFILSLPGIASLALSIFAIPIHLNVQGLSNYGEYIFFHFILSLGLLFNLGFGKLTTICISKHKNNRDEIITSNINLTIKISILYFLIYFFFNYFFNLNYDYIYFCIGLILTVIYFSLEGILLGEKKFKKLSIANLIFFSLSLNLPSLILFFKSFSLSEVIKLSLMIKLFIIILMFFEFIKYFKFEKKNQGILYEKIISNFKWISFTLINVQISNFIDKYLIKFFLGVDLLSKYSIPQQLSGKLSILSQSFSAFLLQNLSENNKKKNQKNLYLSVGLFFYLTPLIIFLILPTFDFFLKFWLQSNYDSIIYDLLKIFIVYGIFSSTSHLIISKFESNFKIKSNFKIELLCLIPFAILLFFSTKNNFSLIFISIIMLLKEIALLTLRFRFFKKDLGIFSKNYFKNLFLIIICLYLSFFNMIIFYFFIILIYLPFNIYVFNKLSSSKNF